MKTDIQRTRKTIPCIIEKCLKYPACKNKRHIVCDKLNIYATYVEEHFNTCHRTNNPGGDMWDHLHECLPNLKIIHSDERSATTSVFNFPIRF